MRQDRHFPTQLTKIEGLMTQIVTSTDRHERMDTTDIHGGHASNGMLRQQKLTGTDWLLCRNRYKRCETDWKWIVLPISFSTFITVLLYKLFCRQEVDPNIFFGSAAITVFSLTIYSILPIQH